MGTNYYFVVGEERYHIGKSSGGWRFSWAWKSIFELMRIFKVKIMIYVEHTKQTVDHTDVICNWINDMHSLYSNPGIVDIPVLTETMFFDAFKELATHAIIIDEYGCEDSIESFMEMVANKQSGLTSTSYKFSSIDWSETEKFSKETETHIRFLPKKYLEKLRVRILDGGEYRIGSLCGSFYEFS